MRLDDQPWLATSATRAVMAALEAAGGPGCACPASPGTAAAAIRRSVS
jgi:hypothetical protein